MRFACPTTDGNILSLIENHYLLQGQSGITQLSGREANISRSRLFADTQDLTAEFMKLIQGDISVIIHGAGGKGRVVTHLDTESSWKSTGEETSLQIVGQ